MTDVDGSARESHALDTSKAHPARRYDYWLGGKDNFQADRDSGDAIEARFPAIRLAVIENRRFLGRAARYLAGEAGIRQFLDIGTGLPTAENVHQVVQRIEPTACVVYADNDPLVLSHARALLTSSPEGTTEYIDADLRDPEKILSAARRTLDFTQPVALMLVSILHFISDDTAARRAVRALVDALPAGSYVVLAHATGDFMPAEQADELVAADRRVEFGFRSREQVLAFVEGFELVEPGIVTVAEWRPDPTEQPLPAPEDTAIWALVARKGRPTGGKTTQAG